MPAIAQRIGSAPWPVWRESLGVHKVKFIPYPKPRVVRWYHQGLKRLTLWETRRCALKANGRRTAAHTAKLVLHTLIFDFYNFRTGQLDPSYEAIAAKAGVGRASVARSLALLKRLGLIDWIRRCFGKTDADGHYQLEQDTNAYRLVPSSEWSEPAGDTTPPPKGDAWGAKPPLPDLFAQADLDDRDAAAAGVSAGDRQRRKIAVLESDPNDWLAAMKARALRRDLPPIAADSNGVRPPTQDPDLNELLRSILLAARASKDAKKS